MATGPIPTDRQSTNSVQQPKIIVFKGEKNGFGDNLAAIFLKSKKPHAHEQFKNDMPYAAVDVACGLALKFPLRPLFS
ncbi:hypothetical protein [Mesorhizobium sp. NPDC059025]|uniref:hypothetical protein n=1 Tax=unclassified Mesorhizobium TaxID=325217 RepID=UPI00367EDAE8